MRVIELKENDSYSTTSNSLIAYIVECKEYLLFYLCSIKNNRMLFLFSECLLSFSVLCSCLIGSCKELLISMCVITHDASENLASITAGEAGLHCVRNNNTNETCYHLTLIGRCIGGEFWA